MAPVFSRIALTREYLLAQQAERSSTGLTERELKAILRAHLKKKTLNPSPAFYVEAVDAIMQQDPPVTVNWAWVIKQQGEPNKVDEEIAKFYENKLLRLPDDQNHLLQENDQGNQQDQALPDNPGNRPALPTTSKYVWRGSAEELLDDSQAEYWKIVSYGKPHHPDGDVNLYDPKIVVMNYFGDDLYDMVITRFHTLNVEDLIRFFGVPADCGDGAAEIRAKSRALQIETKALIERVIFDRGLTPIPEGQAFKVLWHIPGYHANVGEALVTYHPDEEPNLCWRVDVDDSHVLPIFGDPKAMRVFLIVRLYCLPGSGSPQTEADRITELVGNYLLERDENNAIVKAIRKCNRVSADKRKGQKPKRWIEWVERVHLIKEFETKVAPSASNNEIRGKKITNLAVAHMLLASGPWVADCLSAHKLITRRRLWPKVAGYLNDDSEKVIGIHAFMQKLEQFKKD
ncbi:hypothetical protein MVEN_02102900 [Mycena venus]|uniref:Uncharacterized protein n=1 Tax=Mycena venus TaxID=2733690 RepID=A0A8H6XA08_9AGAR|nr:hypothetical protein MVEN_02102900 [Mycena venus]